MESLVGLENQDFYSQFIINPCICYCWCNYSVSWYIIIGMKITKLEHSGIIIEKDGKRVVFDPVEIRGKIPKLENVVAIVITHKHGDHLQPEIRADYKKLRPGESITDNVKSL